jgi:hypothetical protein
MVNARKIPRIVIRENRGCYTKDRVVPHGDNLGDILERQVGYSGIDMNRFRNMEFVYATWFGHLTFLFFVGLTVLSEGAANAYAQIESARASRIHGSVKIGTIPLSGVRLSATNTVSGKKVITISDGSGTYSLTTPGEGRYPVRAEYQALTAPSREVVLSGTGSDQEVDFSFAAESNSQLQGSTANLTSLWPPLILPPISISSLSMQPATGTTGGNSGAQFPSFSGDASFSGDTFSVTGQTQIAIPYFQMADQMRQDFEDGHELQSPSRQPLAGVMGESTPSSNVNSKTSTVTVARTDQLHGEFFWAGGNSALNAEPFVLAGQPRPNPSYNSNGYGVVIDDASSINGGIPVVAQNWQDIPAEIGDSSFDIRHQIIGNFLYALPFGPKAKLLNEGWISHAADNWSVSGFFTLATGVPLTPYVSASVAEVERGTHGSVRPNRVPGVSITEGSGHIDHWFNTAAFSADFAPNQVFGDASRYSIPGPGTMNVNLSISKIISLADGRSLELRGTANNALNIVQCAGVNMQIGSSTFGYVNAVQPMRQITFLARFRF